MLITDILIEIATAFIGTLGFGILFNIREKKLLFAAFGGMLSWLLFLLLGFGMPNEALRYFIVSICSTTYAEIFARVFKTPATTFSIVTLIPLVPGAALYYTTAFALGGDVELFIPKLVSTIELTVALSLGIVIVSAIFGHHKKAKITRAYKDTPHKAHPL